MTNCLSVRVLGLHQTISLIRQSVRHFRRNNVFRREEDGHKRSPPGPHLTLSLTLENNKKANPENSLEMRRAHRPLRRAARHHCAKKHQCVPSNTMCCANLNLASINQWLIPGFLIVDVVLSPSGLWSSQQQQAQASRCLLQLCLIQTPTAIQRQHVLVFS